MYQQANIIYFDPFYFKNGNSSKPKYFIVLHNDTVNTVLASLPTRTDAVPASIDIKHGCINDNAINFNCYYFEANKVVASNGFAFNQPTFVYGAQIENYELSILNNIYQVAGIDYEIVGTLQPNEFKNMIACFIQSASIKQKFKPILKNILANSTT